MSDSVFLVFILVLVFISALALGLFRGCNWMGWSAAALGSDLDSTLLASVLSWIGFGLDWFAWARLDWVGLDLQCSIQFTGNIYGPFDSRV